MQKINTIAKHIDSAKSLTREAESVGGFGGFARNALSRQTFGLVDSANTKRSRLNTKAISMQNEAMAEMNTLLQESVKLSTISTAFAQAMIISLSTMVENGFENAYGQIEQLSGIAKEQAQILIAQTKKSGQAQKARENSLNVTRDKMAFIALIVACVALAMSAGSIALQFLR